MKTILSVLATLSLGLAPLAHANGASDDERLVLLVKGQLSQIQAEMPAPFNDLAFVLEEESLRCVAFPGSMLGSCIIAGKMQDRGGTRSFLQIGVKQAEEDGQEGVRFETRVILSWAW
jgi:hypothetical protein